MSIVGFRTKSLQVWWKIDTTFLLFTLFLLLNLRSKNQPHTIVYCLSTCFTLLLIVWEAGEQLRKQDSFSSLLVFIHSFYSPISNKYYLLSFWSRSCCKFHFGAYYFLKHVPTLKWPVCAKSAVKHGDSRLCVRGEMVGERCGKTTKVLAA